MTTAQVLQQKANHQRDTDKQNTILLYTTHKSCEIQFIFEENKTQNIQY